VTRLRLLASIFAFALPLVISSPAGATDHPRSQAFGSSCALGCGAGIGWDAATAIDGNPHTAWSSVLHWSPSSGAEWMAYYWDQIRETDHVHIQGRIHEGRPIHLPPTVHVFYASYTPSGASWVYITSINIPADVSPKGVTIQFPASVMSNGVLLWADTLRAQPGTSYYYFQIGEVDAGLNQCDVADTGHQLLSDWCSVVPGFRTNVLTDTHYLYNPYVSIGLNRSFGGASFELYGADPRHNLIFPHGGAAMQLSLYGYGTNNEHQGLAISCGPAFENWPFNPIMAVVEDCWWDGPSNDIQWADLYQDATTLHMGKFNPNNYSKRPPLQNLFWAEAAHVDPGKPYVRMDYHISYSASATITMIPHPQEMPAFFTASGVNYAYTYVNDQSQLTTITQPNSQFSTRLPNRTNYWNETPVWPTNKEEWISVCDQSSTRCVTMAAFSPASKYLTGGLFSDPWSATESGYINTYGVFALVPGTEVFFSVYIFPYKHDQIVAGKTVRQWVADLKAAQ
jgi:hypothetical protein